MIKAQQVVMLLLARAVGQAALGQVGGWLAP
jgi:hypothetical protein